MSMWNSARITSPIVRNVIFPLWARRDHPFYQAYVREFEQSQFKTSSEIQALQLTRLREILQHAYQNCPFYRMRMEQSGLHPSTLVSLNDLEKLPILTKRDIQDSSAGMM